VEPPFTSLPRNVCARCRRPEVVCYCKWITPLATRTRVVILQHPRERDVPINTARIAALCLPQAEVHVGVDFGSAPYLSAPPQPAVLLYPDDEAESTPQAWSARGPITLVVVDGTWAQARKIVRTNSVLAKLPRCSFRPPTPSDYRIRREPRDDYVSTIEALVHVLGELEGDPGRFASMLVPFRAMVDAQLSFATRRAGPPRALLKKRVRPASDAHALPAVLHERWEDLVCVYGEASSWPYDAAERTARPDELVHWVACRPATGESFEAIVAPLGPLAPSTPHHVDLPASVLATGMTTSELGARWAAFARPTDVICAWGHYASSVFLAAGGALADERIDVRVAARIHARAKVGTMEEHRARLGLAVPAPLGAGRAGRRLADLVAITRVLSAARASSEGSPRSARG
jgi:DTW domain-containing protein YfiP